MNWPARLSSLLGPRLLVVLGARGTILLSGLLVSIITAKALGPSGRGDFFWSITFATLVSQFSNFGLPSSNTYVVAANSTLLTPLVSNSLWVSLLAGGVSIPALVVFQQLRWAPAISGLILCLPLLTASLLFFLLGGYLLVAVGRIDAFNSGQIVANSTVVLATMIAWRVHLGVSGFLIATMLARAGAALFVLYLLLRSCKLRFSFDWGLFKFAFRFSLKAYVSTLEAFVVLRTNVFMLQGLVGNREVGLYSIACQIADVMVLLPDTMAMLLFPDLVRNSGRRWEMTRRALMATGGLMAAICLCAALAATPLVTHVFGQAYAPAIPIFLWMLPGVLCLSITSILSQNLAAHGFPFSVVLAWSGTLVCGLLSAWCFIRTEGERGAAMSYSLTYAVLLTVIVLCTRDVNSRRNREGVAEPVGAVAE